MTAHSIGWGIVDNSGGWRGFSWRAEITGRDSKVNHSVHLKWADKARGQLAGPHLEGEILSRELKNAGEETVVYV